MCFAPQRRALFRHLNFQKWSKPGVLCTFWLQNVLCATTACTFRQRSCKKMLRTCHFFLHFWLGNVLRATTGCKFSPLIWPAGSAPAAFRPSGATNHSKNTLFCDFPTFSRTWIFFLLRLSLFWFSFFFSSLLFSSLTLPISVFYLSILSEVWLLNFLRSVVSVNLSTNKIRAGNKRQEYIYIYIHYIYTIYIMIS